MNGSRSRSGGGTDETANQEHTVNAGRTAVQDEADVAGQPDIAERADALERAAELARGRLADDAVDAAMAVAAKTRARLRHGTDRTVVALAGPTGAGKSSLFNALVGADVSTPGVKRPTTSVAHAAVWGADEPRLLRWLEVGRRYLVEPGSTGAEGMLDGLILIDLPDVDSVETSNRLEAGRLIDVVDAMVWVVDPQKYADDVVHDHISALGEHADVLRFALTKIDLIPEPERAAVVADLTGRLHADGIATPTIWPVSVGDGANATSDDTRDHGGMGIGAVTVGLGEIVADQRALTERLSVDLRAAAAGLSTGTIGTGTIGTGTISTGTIGTGTIGAVVATPHRIRDRALGEVAAAAHVDRLAGAVSSQYRREARRRCGWPPMEWIRRRRPSPVAQVAARGAIDQLRIESALRSAAEAGAGEIGAPWDAIVRREVMARSDDVADALRTRSINVARHVGASPRWWSAFAWLQGALLAAVVAGMIWLVAVAVAGGLGLATDPLILKIGPTPIPSALVVGGVGLGIVVALIARVPANIGGRRRERRALTEMMAQTSEVLDREVVAPIEHVVADRAEIERLAALAAGDRPPAPVSRRQPGR